MIESYARLFAKDRRPIAFFVLVMSALAVLGLTRLEFDDEPRGIFASENAEYARLLELQANFGSDDNDVLFVCESDDWFDAPRVEVLRALASGAQELAGIQSVFWMGIVPVFEPGRLPRSLLDKPDDRSLAQAHPLVHGQLLSGDGHVTLVVARIQEEIQKIEGIERVVDELRGLASRASMEPGVRVRVTGIPPIRADVFSRIHRDQMLFTILGGVLCALLALYMFRSLGAVVATTAPALVGALWAMGFIGLIGYEINLMSAVLQMVVIVIGLTDAIHLVMDMRVSRAKGMDPVEAASQGIAQLGLPCFLTSITTAVGFGSLALAGVPIIRDFGIVASGGILLSFLAIITSMPLIASCMPSVGRSRIVEGEGALSGRGMAWGKRVLGLALGSPKLTVGLGGVVMLALLGAALRLQPENRLTEALPRAESFEALRLCEEAFGGVLPNYVVLEWGSDLQLDSPEVLASLQGASDLLAGIEGMGVPLSYLNLLDALPGGRANSAARVLIPKDVSRRLAREDLRRALVIAAVPDGPTEVMQPLFRSIRDGLAKLGQQHPGVGFQLTGTDVVARASVNGMISDLAVSLAFAALLIFGVISLEFRSLRLGLISLLPNLFPLALVGGVLYALGRPLQMSSAVLFTVLLGLAVDDTIHFLSRYRRELHSSPNVEHAVRSAFFSVGRAIVITTLVLMLGFGCLAFSAIPLNQLFAGLACLGLAGALLGDLLLLPALLVLFEKKSH